MIAHAASRKYAIIWLNDRDLLWCRAALLSGTILSPPMLARLLIGSPETVLVHYRVL
jgi:hypothetical protein